MKQWITVCFVILSMLFLRMVNILQNDGMTIVLGIVSCMILIWQQKCQDENHKQNRLHYDNLDWARYLSAILVVLLHLRPFAGQIDGLDLAINNIIGRICVPLFFVITGYFVAKKSQQDENYIRNYIKSMIPNYLFWSILYLLVDIHVVYQNWDLIWQYYPFGQLPLLVQGLLWVVAIPMGLVVMLIYSGTYYHLWYYPALITSLLCIDYWQKRYSVKALYMLSFFLLIFGASETYYGMLPEVVQGYIDIYYHVFVTTRNFLFFGLFYVGMGFFIAKKKKLYTNYVLPKLLVSLGLLVFEALILQSVYRLNSNIMLACIPVTYYLFLTLLYSDCYLPKVKNLRVYYKYYYLIHPLILHIFVGMFQEWLNKHVILLCLVVLGLVHGSSLLVMWLKTKNIRILKDM